MTEYYNCVVILVITAKNIFFRYLYLSDFQSYITSIEIAVPIPEPSIVFTVKLGASLIKHIKATASSMGVSISTVVKMALEEFLSKPYRGTKKETS